MSANVPKQTLTARAWGAALVLSWWGAIVGEGYRVASLVSRCVHAIFSAYQALNFARALDPLVFTIGAPTVFGLGSVLVIPYYLYDMGRILINDNPLKARVFTIVSDIGNLGVSVGAVLKSIDYIWQLSLPLQWLPPFQVISAAASTLQVGIHATELHQLKKVRAALDKVNGTLKISPESATRFLDIPAHRYKEFVEILKREPNGGGAYVKARLDAKIKVQRLKVVAGVISVIALVVLIALTFSPAAPAVVIAVGTIGVYALLGISAVMAGRAAYCQYMASDPYKHARTV